MRAIFCQDGYTFEGTVPEVTGLFPALRFTYRPCTGPQRKRYLSTPPDKEEEAAAKLFLDHVKDSVVRTVELHAGKEALGEPMALRAGQFNDLQPHYWTGIINRILGFEGPDPGAAEKNSPPASG